MTNAWRPLMTAGTLILCGLLTACGGGDGSGQSSASNPPSATTPPPTTTPPTTPPPTTPPTSPPPTTPPTGPSTQAPAAPTGLSAAAADRQISLTWSATSGATSYNVYRDSTLLGSPTSTSYMDSGLSNGTSYVYQVSAVNSAGESAKSTAVNATPQPGQTACAFPALPANDCNPWLPMAASGKRWQLTFSEEFNGADYDHSKLTPCFDWNYGGCTATFNEGREYYAASQVRVSGGVARLVAEPVSPPIASNACLNGSCTYLSGMLATSRARADNGSDYLYKFTYGYVEAKLKLIGTQGFFTAFWMLPAKHDPYDYATEIDILEHLGHDPATMFMTYHYDNRNQSYPVNTAEGNNGACPAIDYTTDFHRFGLDWQPTYVAWYIDGVKCGQFNGDRTSIESGPMQIILDVMVDHSWQRRWNKGLLDPTLSRSLEVEYIRVFQQR